MVIPGLIAAALSLAPQTATQHDAHAQHRADMDHRGQQAMGFDQARIRHTFAAAERGGVIEIVAKDPKDSETVARIRGHLGFGT